MVAVDSIIINWYCTMNTLLEQIELVVLKVIRRIYRIFHKRWSGHHITLQNEDVSDYIYEALISDSPFMLARIGTTEFRAIVSQEVKKASLIKRYQYFLKGWISSIRNIPQIEQEAINQVFFHAGIFPNHSSMLQVFHREMMQSIAITDVLAVWLDEDMLAIPRSTKMCSAGSTDPYDYAQPWSRALTGKKVLVIHPFTETIRSQYERKEKLWEDPNVLPDFDLKTLKAVQTITGESSQFQDWSAALDYMKRQIDSIDFDVAIIGCGAYGFPLAAYCKQIGKKAIHLAGATQILFGIKGKRWDDMPAVNKFYNEYWVRPLPDETPKQAKKVEDGCYW